MAFQKKFRHMKTASINKPVFLIGYMGAGKTTLGQILANRLGLAFLDLDRYIEKQEGKSISRIFADSGETAFRRIESKALRSISKLKGIIVATGGGCPCFADNMDYMNACGYTIYLRWEARELAERLQADRKNERPLLAGLDATALSDFVVQGLSKREASYHQAQFCVSGTESEMLRQMTQELQKAASNTVGTMVANGEHQKL